MALHAPPQGHRAAALTIMAAAVVAAMALVVSLVSDIRYALRTELPANLGDIQSVDVRSLVTNTYVRLEGIPSASRAVAFSRGLGGRYRVFPLAGQRAVYVQVPDEGGESFVRSEFTGRLVTFDTLGGRYAELAEVMRKQVGLPVTEESYLLLADETPSSYRWTWLVAFACVAFMLLDAYFIVRWFRPVKWAQIPPSSGPTAPV